MKFVVKRGKREEYIKAWMYMYKADKEGFKDHIYDGVNPALNKKPLGTEIDNFCTIVYDSEIDCKDNDFEYGRPVGIFSFVITPRQNIGKQFIVTKEYLGKGIGKLLLLENEKNLKDNGYDKYYIGCSHCSAGIYRKHLKIEPYNSDIEGDLFKFNVDLNRESFNEQYTEMVLGNKYLDKIVGEDNKIIYERKIINNKVKENENFNIDNNNNNNKNSDKKEEKDIESSDIDSKIQSKNRDNSKGKIENSIVNSNSINKFENDKVNRKISKTREKKIKRSLQGKRSKIKRRKNRNKRMK